MQAETGAKKVQGNGRKIIQNKGRDKQRRKMRVRLDEMQSGRGRRAREGREK